MSRNSGVVNKGEAQRPFSAPLRNPSSLCMPLDHGHFTLLAHPHKTFFTFFTSCASSLIRVTVLAKQRRSLKITVSAGGRAK